MDRYNDEVKDLNDYTDEELQDEIDSRKKKKSLPKMLKSPDFTNLVDTIKSCIDDTIKKDYWNEDNDHYIVEAAIGCCFKDPSKYNKWLSQFNG